MFTRPEDALVEPEPPAADKPVVREPGPARAGGPSLAPWMIVIGLLLLVVVAAYLIAPLSNARESSERPAATERRD